MSIFNVSARAGDWVEVKSAEEILATLDERGELDGLPFMPEMLQYCGRRFRVYKSAHKSCDTLRTHHNRGVRDAVHLEGLRCDGSAHGACQALCLLYWKTSWVKRVPGPTDAHEQAGQMAGSRSSSAVALLTAATRANDSTSGLEQPKYRCQATEMFRASASLRWWDPRHYVTDLVSGNVSPWQFIKSLAIAAHNVVMRLNWRLRPYPYVCGTGPSPTPTAVLDLQAGEFVEIRSREEIMATLNAGGNRNRGLSFDVEMVPYCGRTMRVLQRVDRIIDEKTGHLITFPTPSVILEGATCSGYLSRDRLFCPRSIYPFWREIWLKRVPAARSLSEAP